MSARRIASHRTSASTVVLHFIGTTSGYDHARSASSCIVLRTARYTLGRSISGNPKRHDIRRVISMQEGASFLWQAAEAKRQQICAAKGYGPSRGWGEVTAFLPFCEECSTVDMYLYLLSEIRFARAPLRFPGVAVLLDDRLQQGDHVPLSKPR